MRTQGTWLLLLLAAGLLALPAAPLACAEEEPGGEEAEESEESEALSPEEAKRLEKELVRAAKRRKAEEVLVVLDAVGDRTHPSFEKPLLKMMTHDATPVAVRATDLLALFEPESDRDRSKLAKSIWKKGFSDRKNNRRYVVQGRALVAAVTIENGEELDNNRYKDLERLWRIVIGDPQEANAPAIVAVCEYVRLSKDKRLCRMLAEEIDEPGATAVNSPSNPPAEWWERRWKMWKQYKAEVVEALEELTGQSFKDTASAKAWFEENEKEFGFRW